MKTQEWTNIDRKEWPSGPWDGEPDKVQWQDEETGLPCLAVRNPRNGNWCGYVGVAEGHPLYEKPYDEADLDVHGGLTFSDFCQPHNDEGRGICHVPGEGEPDRVWWLGFDCAHAWDYSPADKARERDRPESIWRVMPDQSYKSLRYVKNQCTELAKQIKEAK